MDNDEIVKSVVAVHKARVNPIALNEVLQAGTISLTSFDGHCVRIDFETRENAAQLFSILAECRHMDDKAYYKSLDWKGKLQYLWYYYSYDPFGLSDRLERLKEWTRYNDYMLSTTFAAILFVIAGMLMVSVFIG